MADSYHIIDGQVVPFHGGRKDTNTGAWRDATPMELQLQSELHAAERALEEAAEWKERAERLEEALRMIANQGPHYGPDGTYKTWRHWADIARASLDQEGNSE